MKNKKGVVWPHLLQLVLVAVALIIIAWILQVQFGAFHLGTTRCKGTCMTACGSYMHLLEGDEGCRRKTKDETMLCCDTKELEGEQRGYGANNQMIRLTLNGGKSPFYYGEMRELEIGKTYYLELFFDDEIRENIDKNASYCGVWIEDRDLSTDYGLHDLYTSFNQQKVKKYDEPRKAPLIPQDENIVGTIDEKGSIVRSCKRAGKEELFLYPQVFTPNELNAGRTYELRVIVYSEEVTKIINENFVGPVTPTHGPSSFGYDGAKAIIDEDNWVAEFTAYFKVKPIIEISDISGTWVIEDDIIVRSVNPYKLSKVEVGIVGETELNAVTNADEKSLYQKIYDACSADSFQSNYKSSIHKITSIKSGSAGLNLGIGTLGRNAYVRRSYISQEQPITVAKNKAEILLDESSINRTFTNVRNSMLEEGEGEFKEHYLCVRSQVVAPDGKLMPIISTSQQPLRLDVAPPKVDNTDNYIKVVYPKAQLLQNNLQKLINNGRVLPEQTITPYYFEQYPMIQIAKCIDKSGCKNYDYYFAPTNIPINIHSADLETGIVATILGVGLNYLYKAIVESNPLKTVCPLADSGQYRRNTRPEIRFYRRQQGVFCIKISDAAGNYRLTWKVAYNPYDIVEETAGAVISNATNPSITPVVGS